MDCWISNSSNDSTPAWSLQKFHQASAPLGTLRLIETSVVQLHSIETKHGSCATWASLNIGATLKFIGNYYCWQETTCNTIPLILSRTSRRTLNETFKCHPSCWQELISSHRLIGGTSGELAITFAPEQRWVITVDPTCCCRCHRFRSPSQVAISLHIGQFQGLKFPWWLGGNMSTHRVSGLRKDPPEFSDHLCNHVSSNSASISSPHFQSWVTGSSSRWHEKVAKEKTL